MLLVLVLNLVHLKKTREIELNLILKMPNYIQDKEHIIYGLMTVAWLYL